MRKQMKCAAAYKRALWEPEERGDEGWEEEGDVEGVGDGNVVGGGVRGRMGVVVGRVRSGSEMRVGAATDRRRETAACKRPVVRTPTAPARCAELAVRSPTLQILQLQTFRPARRQPR